MQMLTEQQIALFEEMQEEAIDQDAGFDISDEEADAHVEAHLKITASSSGGLYPDCSVTGGSCSGC